MEKIQKYLIRNYKSHIVNFHDKIVKKDLVLWLVYIKSNSILFFLCNSCCERDHFKIYERKSQTKQTYLVYKEIHFYHFSHKKIVAALVHSQPGKFGQIR